MDPLSIILSALSVAGAALTPISNQAVKDGYAGFKAVIIRKFADRSPELETTLARYEQKPEVWQAPVRDLLQAAGADRDQELLDQATALLEQAEAAQPGITGGLVGQINAQGGKINVIGGNVGTIHMR